MRIGLFRCLAVAGAVLAVSLVTGLGCSCSSSPETSDVWTDEMTDEQLEVHEYANEKKIGIDLRRYNVGNEPGGILDIFDCTDQQFTEFLDSAPAGTFLVTTINITTKKLTDVGMQQLTRFEQATEVVLDNTKITNEGLVYLAELKQIEILSLAGTKITDAGLAYLTGLPKLRTLRLSLCKSVTDRGMAEVARMSSSLTDLALDDTAISDAGLDQLHGMKQLRLLSIQQAPGEENEPHVTKAGVDALQAALSETRIINSFDVPKNPNS